MSQDVVLPTDVERKMLRDSVRGFLKDNWPVERAVDQATQPEALARIWRELSRQGLVCLGTEPSEAGLREIVIVMEELGRASCPAPILEAVVANIALWQRRGISADVRALLEALHEGKAAVAVAFGAFDNDGAAGMASMEGGAVCGRLRFVEGASGASHILVFGKEGPAAAIVPADAPGVRVATLPGLAVPPLNEVFLDRASSTTVAMAAGLPEDLCLLYRLGLSARAEGAARRSFDLVVDYARKREQFGRPIGSFQAIQHKLANCLIGLDGARLTITHAATVYDLGSPDWRVFASAAFAFASSTIRRVSLETHHTFGAIGYAEEHEAPRHFRRVHADLVRCGGVLHAREELAAYLLGPAD